MIHAKVRGIDWTAAPTTLKVSSRARGETRLIDTPSLLPRAEAENEKDDDDDESERRPLCPPVRRQICTQLENVCASR